MHVKLRYKSETAVSRTVPTPVNPEWSSQPHGQEINDTHRANEFGVFVEPFKTSECIGLSVIGVKANSKEELGVLHIPLADAICCCTEN